jgi:hypothetical protein
MDYTKRINEIAQMLEQKGMSRTEVSNTLRELQELMTDEALDQLADQVVDKPEYLSRIAALEGKSQAEGAQEFNKIAQELWQMNLVDRVDKMVCETLEESVKAGEELKQDLPGLQAGDPVVTEKYTRQADEIPENLQGALDQAKEELVRNLQARSDTASAGGSM